MQSHIFNIRPQAFRHIHCIFEKKGFLKREKGSNPRFNLFQIGP
jgi:hypothetical protein